MDIAGAAREANHYIDGRWVGAVAVDRRAASIDPATGSTLGTFADGGVEEARAAIAAARRAFDQTTWRRDPRRRAALLHQLADRLDAARPRLAALLTAENGKLLRESEVECANAAQMVRYNAGLARNVFGRVSEVEPSLMAMIAREPIGVAAIIVPWNAPIGLLFRSLAPALAAGCTVVVKPAPQTSLVTAAAWELLASIEGFPPGVVNLVTETGNVVARELVASPSVDVVSYTGSTAVGKLIMQSAAATLKRLNLELGGTTPSILFEDVDLPRAVPAIVRAGLIFAGQQCVAISRLLVHRTRYAEVVDRLSQALRSVVVGHGSDPRSQMGPLIDVVSRDRVARIVDAASTTHEILLRGSIPGGDLASGAFLLPSLVGVRDRASSLVHEEIFGPVLSVDTFEDEAEAIALAANTRCGLAASLWTQDLRRAQRAAAQLRFGTVWINGHGRFHPEVEIGGYGESGLGRLNGQSGLDDFLQTKHVSWEL